MTRRWCWSAQSAVDLAQANVAALRERLLLDQITLGYTVLRAPFAGVIAVRQAELGELAGPGVAIFSLDDLDHVWLRAYVNEPDLGKVRLGQAVDVTTDTYPGHVYHGRISFISPQAEFTPKTVQTFAERVTLVYRVRIDIDNPHHELLPGMPADATIRLLARKVMSDDTTIFAAGLTRRFGTVRAVREVGLNVRRGEIFGLVGPDGAGKSTMMRMLAGVLPPDAGRIIIAGVDVVADPEAAKEKLSYMPQRFGLYEDLTVAENIFFYAEMFGVPRALRRQREAELLAAADLGAFRQRLAGQLSGGMKQKLGLVCALIHTPEVLLLDEPTTGVDPGLAPGFLGDPLQFAGKRRHHAALHRLYGRGGALLPAGADGGRGDPPVRHAGAAQAGDAGRAARRERRRSARGKSGARGGAGRARPAADGRPRACPGR